MKISPAVGVAALFHPLQNKGDHPPAGEESQGEVKENLKQLNGCKRFHLQPPSIFGASLLVYFFPAQGGKPQLKDMD
jgi:hypothetical protein